MQNTNTNTNTIFFIVFEIQIQNTSNVFQIQLQILSPHTSYFMALGVTLMRCEDNKYNQNQST